jgi:hypothetical protein
MIPGQNDNIRVNNLTTNFIHIINTMRAAHVAMAKESTAERVANAKNLIAIKNFFKDLFGHCTFSLSRNHPVVA